MPAVLSALTDLDFATVATESLSQCLQPLVTVSHDLMLIPWVQHLCVSTLDLLTIGLGLIAE